MAEKKTQVNRTILSHRIAEDLQRRFKAKCALDGISQTHAIERLITDFVDGKIKIKKQ
ncbi:MAG: hypothetical protein ACLP9S_13805 [Syntrophales bacterium]